VHPSRSAAYDVRVARDVGTGGLHKITIFR
jgi:hypothetical protein